jgi:glyceraldehyde 3-phosphate dehydrogenase
MTKVAIIGLGRIGRAVLKIIQQTPDLELVAINAQTSINNLVSLLRYDSVYGRYSESVNNEGDDLIIADKKISTFNETDLAVLPWKELNIDIVFECTGIFRHRDDLLKHLKADTKHVMLSAPAKDEDVASGIYGVNQLDDGHKDVFSTTSFTTNCIAPVAEIMLRHLGVKAAAVNFISTSTGTSTTTIDVLPQYKNLFDGIPIRTPVAVGSIADMTFVTERATTVEEINNIFREEQNSQRYQGVLGAAEEPIVSSDIIMDPRASVVDLNSTQVIDGDLVKIMSWYDNEWGYASQMVKQAGLLT